MNIKYEFVTGEIFEIEVPETIGEISIAIDKDIQNSNRRETRRHNSVEILKEQGVQITDKRVDIASIIETQELNEKLKKALDMLLPQQQELIRKVFFEGKTIVSVAHELNITKQACNDRLNKIYKRLKKYL